MPPTPVKLAKAGAFRLAIDDASVYWVGPGDPGDAQAPLHSKLPKMPKADATYGSAIAGIVSMMPMRPIVR